MTAPVVDQAPLRIKFKKETANNVYLARDVEVFCGDRMVIGVAAIGVGVDAGGMAEITLQVHAILEADNGTEPIHNDDYAH